MTVSDVLLQILSAHGVRHLFGIPGDAINDVMDAVRRHDEISFIGVRHEESGAFAASAQAKLTGKLSACVGTSGPGAVHLLNGLYDASHDHAPVIAITGQVETGFIGTQYHQEVNLERLFSDVAVYSRTVTTETQVPAVFLEACRAALAHRSVAHISIPTNISGQSATLEDKQLVVTAQSGEVIPADDDCEKAASLIDASQKIAILAGIGCAQARDELVAFAEALKAPIVRTLRAKEVIDDGAPSCIGGLGLLGGTPAVKAMDQCDLLIMVGTDFPYREFYPEKAKTIQIDVDPTRIGKRHPVDIGLAGCAKPTLTRLLSLINPHRKDDFLNAMETEMENWLADLAPVENSTDLPIKSPRVMAALNQLAPDDAIFLSDTGTVTAWSARHLKLRAEQRYTLSSNLASMAFALPGAIGAQLAYPDKRVFALAGDGAFAMLMSDFVTAVKYELPIIVVILNNAKLAFITLEQEAKGLPDWGTDLANPDFAAVATACGGLGITVERPDQLTPALEQALAAKTPTVINVIVDPDELIMPPKISVSQAVKFGLAKIRETFGR